jgi:hypothetical protein
MDAKRRAQRGSLAGGERSAQGPGLHAVGLAVAQVAAPIVKKRGGGVLVRLKSQWAAIVGPPWCDCAWPQALGRDGVLKLRAAPAAALELQHRAPLVIERINLFFGRPVVTRLALVQGPLPFAAAPAPPAPPPDAEATAAVAELLTGIDDPQLRAALLRLGRAVLMAGR